MGFWEEYLKKVTDEDIHLTSRWQKILDTLLVYVRFLPRHCDHPFQSFAIGRTLHRCLDSVHHSVVEYFSAKSGECNEPNSHCDLQ